MGVSTYFENDFLTTLINFLIRRHEKNLRDAHKNIPLHSYFIIIGVSILKYLI